MREQIHNTEESVELRKKLLELVLDKCFRLGDFTLASGKKSDYYIDGRIASLHPEGAYCIGKLFGAHAARLGADCVGGLTLGADPIVGAVVALSKLSGNPVRGFIVRKKTKEHGTGKLLEGDLREGDSVVILEDVVTTGGSALKAVDEATEAGAEVKAVLAVVDREEGGSENFAKRGLVFIPLFKASELKEIAKRRADSNKQ